MSVSFTTSSTGVILSAGVVNGVIVHGATSGDALTLRDGGSTEAIITKFIPPTVGYYFPLGGLAVTGLYIGTTGTYGAITVLYQ
jgi:hypothetical protein